MVPRETERARACAGARRGGVQVAAHRGARFGRGWPGAIWAWMVSFTVSPSISAALGVWRFAVVQDRGSILSRRPVWGPPHLVVGVQCSAAYWV